MGTGPGNGRGKIAFVVTEDWFFYSHFVPMARAARDAGFDIVVIARERNHRRQIEAEGFRLVALEAERRSLNPLAALSALARLKTVLGAERPDLVHLIALRSIFIGGLAARLAGIRRKVIALTGLGYLGTGHGPKAALARGTVRFVLRRLVDDGPQTRYLFENSSDPVTLGLDPDDARKTTIVGGAGIDPDAFSVAPLPPRPPLKAAMVARMLWSKGPDLAVAAVRQARAAGADVTLSLYGAPDPSNPKAIGEDRLRQWASEPGIVWHGPTRSVAEAWATHHLALMPSRGGEGLPRALLEAAACGRALLTTAVPGCQDFVREEVEGLVVPAENVPALAAALVRLAADPSRVEAMGQAARARVLDGYTEAAVSAAVLALYRSLLS